MHLFLIHCGYYDRGAFDGVFEMHADLLVVAKSFADAKTKAKAHPEFARRKMHVDGMMKVEAVDGYRLVPTKDATLKGKTFTPRTPSTWREMNAVSPSAKIKTATKLKKTKIQSSRPLDVAARRRRGGSEEPA